MGKGIITEYFADSGLQASRCDLSGHGSRDSVMMGGILDRKQYGWTQDATRHVHLGGWQG